MKVVMLMPCLMLQNNRKANHRAMSYAVQNYPVDEFIVNDAEFQEGDYREGFTYVGHHKERQGFVKTRNQLLEYFYNSDADYAIWMDANKKVSKSSLNDFITIIEAIKAGEFDKDVIFSTLGAWVSSERVTAKRMLDYFRNVYLTKFKSGYDWMHGLVMKNFNKYYRVKPFIDERCDPRKGWPEDIYFARLLKKLFDCRLAPTVVISAPSNKSSTWVSDKAGYKYPKVDYSAVNDLVEQGVKALNFTPREKTCDTLVYKRQEAYIACLKPYVPRALQDNYRHLLR